MEAKKPAKSPAQWFGFLNQLSKTINLAPENVKSILNVLMEKLIRELEIDAIAVWVIEEKGDFMKIESSSGLSDRYIRFFNKTDRIRVGRGLVGRVMRERKTIFFQSLKEYRDIGIIRWNQMLEEEGVSAILASPMFVGERVIGAFNIYYKHKSHRFSTYEQQFFEILSNHIAIIIENVKNYRIIEADKEDLKNQIEKLISLQNVIQFLNLHIYESVERSIEHLSQYIVEKFEGKGVCIFQNVGENTLQLIAAEGMSKKYLTYIQSHSASIGEGTLVGLAFSTKKPQTSMRVFTDERIAKERRTFMSIEGYIAMGAFPLLVHERIVGVLAVYYDQLHEFTEEEIGVLSTFSQFLGISLENIYNFQSLSTEKEKTKAMINSLHDGLIVYDLEGKIIEVNPRIEELLWIKRTDLIGKHPEKFSSADAAFKNIAEISKMLIGDFQSREIDITEPVIISLEVGQFPLRDEKMRKIGSMRVFHDITEAREVERLKMSFVSTASHQIRTPLTGIKWGLSALLEERSGPLNEDQKKVVRQIITSNENIVELVNDLLDVSRIEEGRFGYRFEKGDILNMVKRIISDFDLSIKTNRFVFTIENPPKMPPISFDKGKLDIAIRNIIDNAIKYTFPGGEINVRFSIGKQSLVISIVDTGIGIPKEDQKFLFNKFFRARNAIKFRTEGSGLGLFIAKNIIEKHNGKITVDSTENKGSTFLIQLPLKEELMPKGAIKGL